MTGGAVGPPADPGDGGGRRRLLLGVAILATAANLRPALASVGPLLGEIRSDLGLGGAQAAILTTAPVLCFALLAPFARPIGRRLGPERTIVGALGLLAVGLALRLAPASPALFAGTILAGGAIALVNVLLPAVVKLDFPTRAGVVTGLYTTVMSGAAAVAAATTVPISTALGLGWRGGLGVWLIPLAVALAAWLPRLRRRRPGPPVREAPGRFRDLARMPLAWQVALLFGLQSLGYYAVLAWLPTIYVGLGFDAAQAGGELGLAILVGTAAAFVAPSLAARARDQRPHLAVMTAVTAAGYLGLLLAPRAAPSAWAALIGLGQGATFPTVLTIIVLRTRNAEETTALSAFAQGIGYLVAAAGPLLLGLVHDATRSWSLALSLLAVLTVPQLLAGLGAGRAIHLGETRRPPGADLRAPAAPGG